MPILEIVAGEAHDRSCDSNRKFTLGPNWIRSPEGIVSSLGGGGGGERWGERCYEGDDPMCKRG